MKAFHETPEMRALVAKRQYAQDRLLINFMRVLSSMLTGVADHLVEQAFASRQMPQIDCPDLIEMFYRYALDNVVEAYEIEGHKGALHLKRLARRIPAGRVPADMERLDDLFGDPRAMQRIFKRSQVLSRGLRTAYLKRLRERFRKIMPAILSNEIGPGEARAYIREAWGASASRARTIFQTEGTKYFAETQIAYYKDSPQIIGYLFHSIRDVSRTAICASRHGLVYRPGTKLLKQNTPSLHFNCRSELVPLANTPANRRMLEDPARDPEKVAVVPAQFKK